MSGWPRPQILLCPEKGSGLAYKESLLTFMVMPQFPQNVAREGQSWENHTPEEALYMVTWFVLGGLFIPKTSALYLLSPESLKREIRAGLFAGSGGAGLCGHVHTHMLGSLVVKPGSRLE